MEFLVDASLPRSIARKLRELGHEALDVRDEDLGSAPDAVIARVAQDRRLALVTGDFDFADIRNYPPEEFYGIVLIHSPRDQAADALDSLISAFVSRTEWLERLPGHLVIIEPTKVRFRPAGN